MEKKRNISQYRERLDKTLTSPELKNEETLRNLIKTQMSLRSQHEVEGCGEHVLEKRTMEVSSFLDMLRSASVKDDEVSKTHETSHGEWKLKQDSEEFRVMYREGPQGTPFHTLLVEGYIDGPIDVCLCISWESGLYKKWWPQYSFPPFRIITSKCLQQVRIGEQLSLVRVKVPWPLSTREAVVHFFLFEYFQDDLIIILVNTISDLEGIDRSTHGFTSDGIPDAKDVVRIGLVGGFALQKVNSERSFFRTIANMDMKLDFVPPALINFISRQLIGSGFKLYQKAVTSMSKSDEDFGKALKDLMYVQIRENLYSFINGKLVRKDLKNDASIIAGEHFNKYMQNGLNEITPQMHSNDLVSESLQAGVEVTNRKITTVEIEEEKSEESTHFKEDIEDIEIKVNINEHKNVSLSKNTVVTGRKAFGEIEEVESEDSRCLDDSFRVTDQPSTNISARKYHVNHKENVCVSPEVEQALGTLEKVISMVREYGLNGQMGYLSGFLNAEPPKLEKAATKNDSNSLEASRACTNGETCAGQSIKDIVERTSQESRNSSGICDIRKSNSHPREGNHNRIAPASPMDQLSVPSEANQVDLCSSNMETSEKPILDQAKPDDKQISVEAIGVHESSPTQQELSRRKMHRFCCFSISFG